jgi:hypothetical protein
MGSIVVGCVAAYGIAGTAGWGAGAALVKSTALAGGAWIIAAAFSAAIIVLATRREIEKLGLIVVFVSFMRMLGAVAIGAGLYFAFRGTAAHASESPTNTIDGKTYWCAFLVAGLTCLMAETTWAMRTLNKLSSASVTAPTSTTAETRSPQIAGA